MDYRILFQKSLFNRTYPFKMSRAWLKDSVVYGVIIWAILYFLQPFGFSMYQGNKFLVSVIFGLVTFCCCALSSGKDKLKAWTDKGYEVTSAKVSYTLAWKPQDSDVEYAVCLANVVISKNGNSTEEIRLNNTAL